MFNRALVIVSHTPSKWLCEAVKSSSSNTSSSPARLRTDGGTAPAATFGGAVAQGEEVLKSVAGKGGELDDGLSTTEATGKYESLSVTSAC